MSMNAATKAAARDQMIHQQLRAWDVLDKDVLDIFDHIPREMFVPPAYTELAFADLEIPLGRGDRMLAPKVVGRIVQAVAPKAISPPVSPRVPAAFAASKCAKTWRRPQGKTCRTRVYATSPSSRPTPSHRKPWAARRTT
jgi:hypothetical protein